MIVRAGEGSARLPSRSSDQAISHGDGKVPRATVKAMLGLGDAPDRRSVQKPLMKGQYRRCAPASLRELYRCGADLETVIADLCRFHQSRHPHQDRSGRGDDVS